ncbi:MAG: DMT family transporter [Clostridia bacterium]|nr:DMT family transporter [Clostridia bacterium]
MPFAPLLVVAAGVLWGFLGYFTRTLYGLGFSSVQITAVRCLMASLFLLLLLGLTRKELLKIKLKHLWYFVGSGIISIVFFNICYFLCIEMLTMSAAAMLLYTSPFFVMLISLFVFKEQITLQKGLSLLMAFIGCMMVIGFIGDSPVVFSTAGILLGLASGFGYALYSIFARLALNYYSSYTVTTYTFTLAALALLPFANWPEIGRIISQQPSVIGTLLGLGFLCTLLPYMIYTIALNLMEASKASITAFAEPLMATVCGMLFFGETLTWQNCLGIILIFLALVFLNANIRVAAFRHKS